MFQIHTESHHTHGEGADWSKMVNMLALLRLDSAVHCSSDNIQLELQRRGVRSGVKQIFNSEYWSVWSTRQYCHLSVCLLRSVTCSWLDTRNVVTWNLPLNLLLATSEKIDRYEENVIIQNQLDCLFLVSPVKSCQSIMLVISKCTMKDLWVI